MKKTNLRFLVLSVILFAMTAKAQTDSIAGFGESGSDQPDMQISAVSHPISSNFAVGKIECSEGVTPMGGKTYTVPIVASQETGFVPQIALFYNSQSPAGCAGRGWSLSGVSSISVTNKTIHYDGYAEAANLSDAAKSVFALDGVRLSKDTQSADGFDLVSEQGFVRVKTNMAGGKITHFDVRYPNGNTAVFGFKGSTPSMAAYPIYPIIEATDPRGFKIFFEYIRTGNLCYLSGIRYGGKSREDCIGRMSFNYETTADFVTSYIAGAALKPDKLLRRIVSVVKVNGAEQTLREYNLYYKESEVLLTKIESGNGSLWMNPLHFDYGYSSAEEGDIILSAGKIISEKSVQSENIVTGKFLEGKYNDGLLIYPEFSPFTKNGENSIGSSMQPSQSIKISPGISLHLDSLSIKAEEGLQAVMPFDYDGDGVDEILRINAIANENPKGTTIKLKVFGIRNYVIEELQKYNIDSFLFLESKKLLFIHPLSFYIGDFDANGKDEILAVFLAFDDILEQSRTQSIFFHIDPYNKTVEELDSPISFKLGSLNRVMIADFNGDGRSELCYVEPNQSSIYSVSKESGISRLFTSNKLGYSEHNSAFTNYKPDFFICDVNADGIADVIYPPARSRINRKATYKVPLWVPANCPSCGVLAPIKNTTSKTCNKCDSNLYQYYYKYDASCILCGSTMSGDYYPDINGFVCPTHGREPANCELLLPDIINGEEWTICLSTGTDFEVQKQKLGAWDNEEFAVMDINNDGFSDIVVNNVTKLQVFINNNGIFKPNNTNFPIAAYSTVINANVNNFGISHIISIKENMATCYEYSIDSGKKGLITSSTDSHGIVSHNEYESLISATSYEYEKPKDSSIPFVAPINLLKSYRRQVDRTSVSDYRFSYYGARLSSKGLGFRGFNKVRTIELLANDTTISEYLDIDKVSKIISRKSIEQHLYCGVGNNDDFGIYQTESKNRLTGALAHISRTFDKYGNVLTEKLWYDGIDDTKLRTTTYQNTATAARYHVGLPLSQEEKNTRGSHTWIDKNVITYNGIGLPLKIITYTGSAGAVKKKEVRRAYDQYGNVLSEITSPYDSGIFTENSFVYDSSGRHLQSSTNELGLATTYSNYDRFGNPLTVTDHRNNATTFEYDALGRFLKKTMPDGIVETSALAWGGGSCLYLCKKTTTGQPDEVAYFDALDREVRSGNLRFNGKWQYTDKTYDHRGRLLSVSLPYTTSAKYRNNYAYDSLDRLLSITEASGKTTTYSYSGLTTTEVKNGIVKTSESDASGKIISVADQGGTIAYEYRADGQPCTITAPGGIVTTIDYDEAGRRKAITDPSAGRQSSEYSYVGGLLKVVETNADNLSITTTYDRYNRKTLVERPEFNTTYTYYDDGQIKSEKSTNGTSKEYTYDNFGRIKKVVESVGSHFLSKTYAFANGNLSSLSLVGEDRAGSSLIYTYRNGSKSDVRCNSALIWRLEEENELGLPTKVQTGYITRTYKYDPFGMPMGRTFGNYQSFSYEFDSETGNLLFRGDNVRNAEETFDYDALNRLCGGSAIGSIDYDANGNILSHENIGEFDYNTGSKAYQLKKLTPADGFSYRAFPVYIRHTSFNRPNRIILEPLYIGLSDEIDKFEPVTPPIVLELGTNAYFTYNADGNRVRMKVSNRGEVLANRIYIGGVYELDSIGFRSLMYLDGDAYTATSVNVTNKYGSKIYFIGRDHMGSITHIADVNGTLVAEYTYDPWGRMREVGTTNAYMPGKEPELMLSRGYCGHEWLPWFGFYNMNARLYDPVLGRFLSPDPYVQAPDFSQSFNRYAYALNNPLIYKDENGEFIFTILTGIGETIANLFKHGFNVSQYDYGKTKNAWDIDRGVFKGSFMQVVGKMTWGIKNTIIGNILAHGFNLAGKVDGVTYMDGVAALSGTLSGNKAMTIGFYIFGPKNFTATWRDHLFVHEYGHFLQSQRWGAMYLPAIGLPSVVSAMGTGEHKKQWYEVNASRLGAKYFDNKYGSKASGYEEGNPNYFSHYYFVHGRYGYRTEYGEDPPYKNPRTNSFNGTHPISNPNMSFWDIFIPALVLGASTLIIL